MANCDDRLTRKTALNLAKAKSTLEASQTFQRRSRSAKRTSNDPRYMESTVSFRAKSPQRRPKSAKSKSKKPLPFLTGQDESNLVRFTRSAGTGKNLLLFLLYYFTHYRISIVTKVLNSEIYLKSGLVFCLEKLVIIFLILNGKYNLYFLTT